MRNPRISPPPRSTQKRPPLPTPRLRMLIPLLPPKTLLQILSSRISRPVVLRLQSAQLPGVADAVAFPGAIHCGFEHSPEDRDFAFAV
jgi:hypothetical protein